MIEINFRVTSADVEERNRCAEAMAAFFKLFMKSTRAEQDDITRACQDLMPDLNRRFNRYSMKAAGIRGRII